MCRFGATNAWTNLDGSVAYMRDRGNDEGIGVTENTTHIAVHDSRHVSPVVTKLHTRPVGGTARAAPPI